MLLEWLVAFKSWTAFSLLLKCPVFGSLCTTMTNVKTGFAVYLTELGTKNMFITINKFLGLLSKSFVVFDFGGRDLPSSTITVSHLAEFFNEQVSVID